MNKLRPLTRFLPLCVLVLTLVISACSPESVNPPGDNIVGPSGGTVRSQDNKVTLEIPEGALTSDTKVTVTAASSESLLPVPGDATLVPGTAYTIKAEGVASFAKPVELSVTFDSSTLDAQTGLRAQEEVPLSYVLAVANAQGWSLLNSCTYAAGPPERIRCSISGVGTFAILQVATNPGAALSVNVTSINGQTPSGTVTVSGEFPITVEVQAGSAPVTKVELLASGISVYSYPLPEPIPATALLSLEVPVNTAQIPNGTYSLTLRVTDSASNTATSKPISVTVNNATPTGGRIVFASDRDGNAEIYLMNADGSGVTRLTNDPATDYMPALSPDGSKIAFTSDRSGELEIYIMNSNGTGATLVGNRSGYNYAPAWSPDGSKIAYVSSEFGYREIFVMNADGSNQVALALNGDRPAWSPDGSKIVFHAVTGKAGTPERNEEIFIMNADGSNKVQLTTNPAADERPDWSPDGSRIVFSSIRDGNWEIYTMNADGSNEVRLTTNLAEDYDPSWSPDGTKIAFITDRDNLGSNLFEIYLMNADGSNQINLTNNPADDQSLGFGR